MTPVDCTPSCAFSANPARTSGTQADGDGELLLGGDSGHAHPTSPGRRMTHPSQPGPSRGPHHTSHSSSGLIASAPWSLQSIGVYKDPGPCTPGRLRSPKRKEKPQAQVRKSYTCHCLPWWISPQPPNTEEPAGKDQAGTGQPGAAAVAAAAEAQELVWQHFSGPNAIGSFGIHLEKGQRSEGYFLYDLKQVVCLL